jgi:integrase
MRSLESDLRARLLAAILARPPDFFERLVLRVLRAMGYGSSGEDTTAVAILREAKSDAPDPVFVLKGAPFRPRTSATPVYRADAAPFRTWERLIAWLATKGIDGPKPIHDLRKLAGSMVHLAYGIEQARDFLGHQSVLTTSASYLSRTPKVMVSLPLLADEVSKAQADRMEASR